jgi:membrane protein YdbS with pleckstrin-like domain
MFETFRRYLLRLLHVPPEPAAPPGESEARIFRAAPRFYTWRRVKWGLAQCGALAGAIFSDLVMAADSVRFPFLGPVITSLIWSAWLVQLVVTYAILRLDYEQRWYILTDRSLRVREGVLRLSEQTMTFANIQHLTVRQGPLQRFLGISDLVVRTAGGGGGSPGTQAGQSGMTASTHIAYFRGVNNAEEIRTAIRERIRHYHDAGLGDPDDAAPSASPEVAATPAAAAIPAAVLTPASLADAVRALGGEARALREVLQRGAGS